MDKNNTIAINSIPENSDLLTQLIRQGAQELIKMAIEAELGELLAEMSHRKTPDGKAGVVRNGYLPEREIQTGIGPVSVQVPKVRSKDGKPITFRSALVPPYVRKTKTLEAALPWLYLKGISTGEMNSALQALLGSDAKGLSANTISRLKIQWANEYKTWTKKSLADQKWVYIWADGVYSKLRGDDGKLCALVVIGVNEFGQKHILAIEDGVRESKQSWMELLLDLKERGMNCPQLAIGDGAMGFWAALDEIFPNVKHQRCWMHKTMNVLNKLPKSVQEKAKEDVHDIWQARTRASAEKAFDFFLKTYEAKYPKATACLAKDHDTLMNFFDFPAEHWQSIRTSNPIESTFGTIRHRTRRSKGCLNRNGMLYMIYKLGMCAESKWRKLRGFKLLGDVISGVTFKDGVRIAA